MAAVDLSQFTDLPDTSAMGIVDAMVAEHERILQEADRLEQMSLAFMVEGSFDAEEYRQVIRFVREYSDAAHHCKEEDVLYDYMLKHLGRVAENLIQHGMLVEHDLGRNAVRNLDAAVSAFEQNPEADSKLEIISWGMEYVHLIRRHVEKENTVVYPFAQRALGDDVLDELTLQAREYVPQV